MEADIRVVKEMLVDAEKSRQAFFESTTKKQLLDAQSKLQRSQKQLTDKQGKLLADVSLMDADAIDPEWASSQHKLSGALDVVNNLVGLLTLHFQWSCSFAKCSFLSRPQRIRLCAGSCCSRTGPGPCTAWR